MTGTNRKKLENFFNPGPSHTTKASRDIEDPDDIYSHTKQFFTKNASANTDQVEIGHRTIRGDIELDDIVYGGKKVTRENLSHIQPSLSGSE